MENQHSESIRSALELCEPERILVSICFAIKDSTTDLRMSAISCLAFLLSLEIQKDFQEKDDIFLRTLLDTTVMHFKAFEFTSNSSEKVRLDMSKPNKNMKTYSNISNKSEKDDTTDNKSLNEKQTIGSELCELLLHLFTVYNYAKSKKNSKQAEDKDLVTGALTNLLCVSKEAKKTALRNNLPETALMILKELYVKLNLQPFELYKKQAEKKVYETKILLNLYFIFLF